MTHLPRPYTSFRDAHPDVSSAHDALAKTCDGGPLDGRTRELVKLGIAIGAQSEGAVKSHTRKALDQGITSEELEHVVIQALTTIGFPEMIASRVWVHEVLDAER